MKYSFHWGPDESGQRAMGMQTATADSTPTAGDWSDVLRARFACKNGTKWAHSMLKGCVMNHPFGINCKIQSWSGWSLILSCLTASAWRGQDLLSSAKPKKGQRCLLFLICRHEDFFFFPPPESQRLKGLFSSPLPLASLCLRWANSAI